MTPIEKLMSTHPNIKYTFRDDFPPKLGGLTYDNEIMINKNRPASDQYQILLEELAHLETSVGDITKESTPSERQQENYARSLALEKAVTLDGLIYCFNDGLWELSEMAEYFNVSGDFILKALDHYRTKRGLIFKYHGYLFDLRRNVNLTKLEP
ncbi:hypothetical protein IWT25_02419 [Secundilactobacillus pentosiphilus]|uniref:IrrE N-terminal-like domain-containing protein n=1 Tax=Secundilactobacillus pentosiphilus TaxID=1714682 RepID=A0A1Z5J013_9LACO|nr:ImmA/IrrE family metallo-endopeptidase [Secundilactobacillus pentosiphilus]GAX07071.1 hypothetical protein IWT25_02419 [Secundilactobacillus pentosiphilus]